jgi:hypothetical protein
MVHLLQEAQQTLEFQLQAAQEPWAILLQQI